MYNFQFFMPTKVLFGAGQLGNLHLEQMPGKKALIVTSNGSSTKKYGYLEAVERVMGSYHDSLAHGAGLIMLSHAYFDFFAERKAAEEPMMKMARAMGVENPKSGKDFIAALDRLIAAVGCADLKMSDHGITREEIKKWPQHIHEVLGGDITADPLPLSDDDDLSIYEASYK